MKINNSPVRRVIYCSFVGVSGNVAGMSKIRITAATDNVVAVLKSYPDPIIDVATYVNIWTSKNVQIKVQIILISVSPRFKPIYVQFKR